ncbi:response regulator [Tardiphaga sp. vice154]|nr:response regulator [Tardiphaga sp. vice154]
MRRSCELLTPCVRDVVERPVGMRALLLDDDASVCAALQAILATQGIEVVTASRAHAGLHALKQSSFDIAIVDIFIPGMGGLDAIQMIRQLLPSIPIVAMTGFRLRPSRNPSMDFLQLAIQRGATYGILKPFSPNQLSHAIRESLAGHSPVQPTPAPEAEYRT